MGDCKKRFWKFWDRNFFSFKIEAKNFEIQFFQKISYTIIRYSKYEFRMISAFIWYVYCPCRWKTVIFQKSVCQKLENLTVKLGRPLELSSVETRQWLDGWPTVFCKSGFPWGYANILYIKKLGRPRGVISACKNGGMLVKKC